MSLCIDNREGYAKLDTFCFRVGGNITPETLIDFGDGRTEMVDNRAVITHSYERYGTFKACLRTCEEVADDAKDCLVVAVKPYIKDAIEFEAAPESGLASVDDGMNFRVCVTTNCPPPIRVRLSVKDTLSPPVEELPDTPFQNCLPRHYFSTNETFEDGVVILDSPSKIFVNGILCGWRDSFCFGYYDDFPSEKEIEVVLERSCDECFDIDWDVCEPVTSCYIYGTEHLPLIDADLGF